MTTTMTQGVFQSRWGYHPCSRETSKKLRFLNRAIMQARHKAAAWERWDHKMPYNRVQKEKGRVVLGDDGKPVLRPEPQVNKVFTKIVPGQVKYGTYYLSQAIVDDFGIPEIAREARTPAATPEEVRPFSPGQLAVIDRLYRENGGE